MKSALKFHIKCTGTLQSSRSTTNFFLAVQHQNDYHKCRLYHESYMPQGRGGRSSFSGVAATIFGGTGFIGHSVINHMAAIGSSLLIPHRGSVDRLFRMKLMGDLGQIMFREFSIKNEDDRARQLIEYSNCVVNLIGARKPFNHYTMEEVNVEWPKRLARLVAEKNDGTRLIHVTHLNCHQEEGRKYSNILRQNYEAEKAVLDIYPDATIVRISNVHGLRDNYISLLLNKKFKSLAFFGAQPLLYDAGKSTNVQPVHVGDVAQAITRIAKHPDAPGEIFELAGPDRMTLHDLVHHVYEITENEPNIYNTIGPLDRSKSTVLQNFLHYFLEWYFWKMDKPRPLPRFLDILTREGSANSMWMTHDLYRQLHISDETTGAPGFDVLGIDPIGVEEKLFENLVCDTKIKFKIRSEENLIPRVPMKKVVSNVPVEHIVA